MCDSCRVRQDDMSPWENNFLGRNWDPRPGSEFTIFNLVIRLSEVKQWAFFNSFHPVILRWLNNWPQYWASPSFDFHPVVCRWFSNWPLYRASFPLVCRGNLLVQLWSRNWPASGIATWQGLGFRTCLSGVVTFFWLIWWGQVVHKFEGWLFQLSMGLI